MNNGGFHNGFLRYFLSHYQIYAYFYAMKRIIILSFLLILSVQGINAGSPPPDTDELTRELMRSSGNIHQFNNIFPQEKVYIEFDNTAYFQG